MLRPLGVGDVLDRTFTVYRSKPLVFIGLSAIWYLLLVLVFVVLAVAVFAGALAAFTRQATTPSPEQIAGAAVGIIGFVIVAVIVAILAFSAQSASLVHAASRRYLAKDVAIGESFRSGLSASGRLFLAGVVVFTVASLLNGLATSSTWLISTRALQGLGAAFISPAALAIISTTFSEGKERGKALGVWAAIASGGSAVGPRRSRSTRTRSSCWMTVDTSATATRDVLDACSWARKHRCWQRRSCRSWVQNQSISGSPPKSCIRGSTNAEPR